MINEPSLNLDRDWKFCGRLGLHLIILHSFDLWFAQLLVKKTLTWECLKMMRWLQRQLELRWAHLALLKKLFYIHLWIHTEFTFQAFRSEIEDCKRGSHLRHCTQDLSSSALCRLPVDVTSSCCKVMLQGHCVRSCSSFMFYGCVPRCRIAVMVPGHGQRSHSELMFPGHGPKSSFGVMFHGHVAWSFTAVMVCGHGPRSLSEIMFQRHGWRSCSALMFHGHVPWLCTAVMVQGLVARSCPKVMFWGHVQSCKKGLVMTLRVALWTSTEKFVLFRLAPEHCWMWHTSCWNTHTLLGLQCGEEF